jgi:hypothetical protein
VPGLKYSHAIYSSYLSGQLPTNYKGEPILSDHIVKSLNRAYGPSYSLKYIGPEWSFLAIFGKDNYDTFFSEVRIEREPLDVSYNHPYPFFFEDPTLQFYHSYLDELKAKGASMFSHTGTHYIHSLHTDYFEGV